MERNNQKKSKMEYAAAAAIILLYALLCANRSVWADEAYTMLVVEKPWPQAWDIIIHDVHPPLYYIIVKLACTLTGYTVPAVKAVSVFFQSAALLLGIWLVKPLFGRKTAYCYMVILGLMPQLIRYGVELRMYPAAMFFVTACGLAAVWLWKNQEKEPSRRMWLLFWGAGIAAAYTHYFALIAVAWIYLLLLAGFYFHAGQIYYVKKTCRQDSPSAAEPSLRRVPFRKGGPSRGIKKWLLCLAASAAAYLPWLAVFAGQAAGLGESYWIAAPSLTEMIRWAGWLFKTSCMPLSMAFTALFAAGFPAAVWLAVRKKDLDMAAAAAGWGVRLLTVGTGAAVTFLINPVFIPRFMLPAAGLAALGMALFLSRLPRRLPAVCLAAALVLGAQGYRDVWAEEYGNQTEETLGYLDRELEPGDLLVYDYQHLEFVLAWYYPEYEAVSSEDFDWDTQGRKWYFQIFQDLTEDEMNEKGMDWTMEGKYGIDEYQFFLYRIQ